MPPHSSWTPVSTFHCCAESRECIWLTYPVYVLCHRLVQHVLIVQQQLLFLSVTLPKAKASLTCSPFRAVRSLTNQATL